MPAGSSLGRRSVRRPSRFAFSTVSVDFESEGLLCRGRLYRPDRPATPPVVVMAPDFAAESSFGYAPFAERLAAAGYAAFRFDYRGFGESEGRPRRLVDPGGQVADWHAALDRVARLDGVRGRRPVLWGFGLSGGHVVRVAADRCVAALLAVVPVLDGRDVLRGRSPRDLGRAGVAGVRDRLGSLVGRGYEIPVATDTAAFSVFSSSLASAYLDLVPTDSDWQNATPARALLSLARYRPVGDAAEVTCPAFLLAGREDSLAPAATVDRAADRMADATYLRMPVDHFDALGGRPAVAEEALAHQLSFLDRVVDPGKR